MIRKFVNAVRGYCRDVRRWVDAQEHGPRLHTRTSRWGNVRFIRLPDGREARLTSCDRKRLAKIVAHQPR